MAPCSPPKALALPWQCPSVTQLCPVWQGCDIHTLSSSDSLGLVAGVAGTGAGSVSWAALLCRQGMVCITEAFALSLAVFVCMLGLCPKIISQLETPSYASLCQAPPAAWTRFREASPHLGTAVLLPPAWATVSGEIPMIGANRFPDLPCVQWKCCRVLVGSCQVPASGVCHRVPVAAGAPRLLHVAPQEQLCCRAQREPRVCAESHKRGSLEFGGQQLSRALCGSCPQQLALTGFTAGGYGRLRPGVSAGHWWAHQHGQARATAILCL